MDLLIGAAAVCLILHCGRQVQDPQEKPPGLLLRILQSRFAVTLGAFSYSLYLTHLPVGWLMRPIVNALHHSGVTLFIFALFVKIPLLCAVAYGFYLLFERPFTSAGNRRQKQLTV